jgi:hypothetical protein
LRASKKLLYIQKEQGQNALAFLLSMFTAAAEISFTG